MTRLQRVQNRAARFTNNHSRLDGMTSETLHDMTNLETVNVYLHREANDIWIKKPGHLDRDRAYNMTYKDMFPSSLRTVTDILPNLLYRYGQRRLD